MPDKPYGTILAGRENAVRESYAKWADQPLDQDMKAENGAAYPPEQSTLQAECAVTGPGTFLGRAQRTTVFRPTWRKGWWFDRQDLPDSLPIRVSVDNVWTTVRNIVLCSGSPHNYMRMVEHMVALKVGLGLDNVMIRMESGDPPLFERGSMDLVEAVERAGVVGTQRPAPYVTVARPVTLAGGRGSFLTFLPAEDGERMLTLDCAVNFRSAIGKQRVRFDVTPDAFRYGAVARTNTTVAKMLYCKTIGLLFADTRNLGYTPRNILVAGRRRYFNKPRLLHEDKALEAAWHRAALDLLAAVALIDRGRLAGTIISYKAGHTLDVQMIRELYRQDLLRPL